MLKIGLTGGIGSGKTAVSDLFEKLGAPVIDTDIIARDLVNNDTAILAELSKTFGVSILKQDGSLDRKKLAEIVFNDDEKKQQLESILHPRIRREVQHKIHDLSQATLSPGYVIIVVPLLFETGFDDIADHTIAVISDEATRIERISKRDNRSLDEIRSIINSQTDDPTRIKLADEVIENNSNINHLRHQVARLHSKFSQLSD